MNPPYPSVYIYYIRGQFRLSTVRHSRKMCSRLSIITITLILALAITCNCEANNRDLSVPLTKSMDIFHMDTNRKQLLGRRRRRKGQHVMTMMMLGLMLMGTVLIPMGFQFLAVLGGKALILAKMALILSSIQGLKKIATSGLNYGLYRSPIGDNSWHDRSNDQGQRVENNLHYPVYELPKDPTSFYLE